MKVKKYIKFVVGIFIMFGFVKSQAQQNAFLADVDSTMYNLPLVKARLLSIKKIVATNRAVLLLPTTDALLQKVQEGFINLPDVQGAFVDDNANKLLVEIFTVHKALPSDIQTPEPTWYKIEMYNYAFNTTLTAIYDFKNNKILQASILENAAPDLPEHLKQLAVEIAISNSQVKQELGGSPTATQAQMAYTKTALNNSKCQRSLHLCVAPTFVKGTKALWSIVDLTDLKLVGVRWTNVGDPGPVQITERKLQNEVISSCYCEKTNEINKNGWQLKYMLTSSDGLKIENVNFKNKKILKSAKLVDWHVSYSNSDGFGYSDGIGCPEFSLSAVVAWDKPTIADLKENNITVGFVLEQIFKSEGWPGACNYNYIQRYEFYNNGKFRVSTASIGRGCGSDGTYRPVFRIAFEGKNTFAEYNGTTFNKWTKEKWTLQKETTPYNNKMAYQIFGAANYNIEPGQGQFADGGRGDNAYAYITKYKTTEGEDDLVTIGPCCNTNYEQGPEKFLNNEKIENEQLVLWYVPQMKNDNRTGKEYCWAEAKIIDGKYTTVTYPCFAGPMFNPINP